MSPGENFNFNEKHQSVNRTNVLGPKNGAHLMEMLEKRSQTERDCSVELHPHTCAKISCLAGAAWMKGAIIKAPGTKQECGARLLTLADFFSSSIKAAHNVDTVS